MPDILPTAAEVAALRDILPTSLGSAELRGAIAEDIRARSVFAARLSNAHVLSVAKEAIDKLAAGEMNMASARLAILQAMRAVGYAPEGGFPDDPPGTVPPAVAGTLQDLSSRRRIDFILRTQLELMRGRGQQLRGSSPEMLREYPAWELVRMLPREAPRRWGGKYDGTPPRRAGAVDPRPRWIIAGGRSLDSGRLIALKGDPIWGELGSSGNFDDALDVDYPPFAFNSGMRWKAISRAECERLGITGPDGESIDGWLSQDHPTLVDTQSGLPAPQAGVKSLDPAIRAEFERQTGIEIVEDTATTQGNAAQVRAAIEARRAAREARRAARISAVKGGAE